MCETIKLCYATLELKERPGGEEGRTGSGSMVGSVIVFCKNAGAILGAEDYNGIDGKQGHARRHDCGVGYCSLASRACAI